jgi:hypothetical protein
MTELCQLAAKYGSDKAVYYTPYYSGLFAARRDIKKVLEFGIGYDCQIMRDNIARAGFTKYTNGASLHMWEDYFPEAQIYGLDIAPQSFVNEGRIHSFYCNQYDDASYVEAMQQIGGDFDLIIDDGDHTYDAQFKAICYLLPLVKKGGLYIVEDIGDWGPELMANVPSPCELKTFVDNQNEMYCARIIVIRP